jgi:integrase
MMLRDFREKILRDIRNEFISVPTSGNAKLDLFNLLWNFVKEFCSSAINLPAVNPATLVPRLETLNDPHKVWPENVIKTFVANPNRLTTLYYLARFTGQRLGDCCKMQRSDFNDEGNQIHVVQEKTGTKIWVPIHRILADHMRSLPTIKGKNNDYLTVNTRGDPWIASTVTEALQLMMQDLVLPAGYTMHGLRHLAGVELAYAGCGENEIAAILGHKDTRQTRRYVEQAQQIKLAESAMAKREAYDEKQEASAAKKKKAA